MTADRAVDLFAGPGGWSLACHAIGIDEIGVELDGCAAHTRDAAGWTTVQADVSAVDPDAYAYAEGLIASPPCPAFSSAGKQHGRRHIDALVDAIRSGDWAARPNPDPEVWLVLEVGRWLDAIDPEWVALEQVPAVQPIWNAYADVLTERGYSVWTGKLNAADYGVPQTRQRAILAASRVRAVDRPPPTHAKAPTGGLLPWVTMADALGWPSTFRVGFPRLDDRGDSPDGYRERDWRNHDEPSFALTEKARSWTLNTGRDWKPGGTRADAQTIDATQRPAPALTHQAISWVYDRPATTILGDPRCWPPGHKINQDDRDRLGDTEAAARYGDRAGSEAIRLTVEQALILQSFPPDYPIRGRPAPTHVQLTLDGFDPVTPAEIRTRQFEQIGNAIPPLLAWHILRAVTVCD